MIDLVAAQAMRPYAIELPNHTLRFALPEEIAKEVTPVQFEKRFDPREPGVMEGGFRGIGGLFRDFNGPFWVGAYGSLKFHLMVHQKNAEYTGDITTIEGLDRYIRWWDPKIDKGTTGCVYSRRTLNAMPAVHREWDSFSGPRKQEPDNLEIFSLPLDGEFFLDIGFSVQAWAPGRGKEAKWKPKAEALREAIKATVVLEPKPVPVRP